MDLSYHKNSATIKAAMAIVDPNGDLTQGGVGHRVVSDTIIKWIEEEGPEKALQMVRESKAHLQDQVAEMAMFE